MINLMSMLNKPVISLNSGFCFGTSKSAKINKGRATGLFTAKINTENDVTDDKKETYFFIPLKNILAYDGDAITLKSEAGISEISEFFNLIGNKVFTQTGVLQGNVKNIEIEENTNKIINIVLDNISIEFNKIDKIAKDTLTLKGDKKIKTIKSSFENRPAFPIVPDEKLHTQKVEIFNPELSADFSNMVYRKLENFASKDLNLSKKFSSLTDDVPLVSKGDTTQTVLRAEMETLVLPKYVSGTNEYYLSNFLNKELKNNLYSSDATLLASKGAFVTKTLLDICLSQNLIEKLKSNL